MNGGVGGCVREMVAAVLAFLIGRMVAVLSVRVWADLFSVQCMGGEGKKTLLIHYAQVSMQSF